MKIKILSSEPSPRAKVRMDRWIPLAVEWEIDPDVSPLYLFVRDQDQGYVELKVHPESGALVGAVVIDMPTLSEPRRTFAGAESSREPATAVLDLELWPWRVTPDYRDPIRRDIDAMTRMSHTTTPDDVTIWFSELEVLRVLRAGPVEIGLSTEDELVAIKASRGTASAH